MRRKTLGFDPYTSFSSNSQCFLNKHYWQVSWLKGNQHSDDVLQLWLLGRAAYQAMGEFRDAAEFNTFFEQHHAGIEIFAEALNKEFINFPAFGEDATSPGLDFSRAPSTVILGIFWELTSSRGELYEPLGHHFLCACIEEIDNALFGLAFKIDHVRAVMEAVQAFGNFQAVSTGNQALQKARSELAGRGAKERHARDPKQAEKIFVLECWKEWRQKPDSYSGKAAFARDMLDKCEHLKSQKNIEDWCREWESLYQL